MPLVTAVDIRKSFGGVRALKGVSIDLRDGEVHALVGENGAGKSTLIRIITGAEVPDSGHLEIAGRGAGRLDPAGARALGVAAIYQQPALFPDLSVAENIALGSEPARAWTRVDWRTRRARARDMLDQLGSSIDPDRLAGALTMPEQQIVEIAKAMASSARVVVMDEPTASLTEREAARLFAIVRALTTAGVGVIYISHRLDEVFALADRITVLRDGETVGTYRPGDVDARTLVALMVGRELAAVFPKRPVHLGEIALEVRDLGSRRASLSNISFDVRHGEILGIAGLVGAGRTELAETLFGLTPAERGTIRVDGAPVRIDSPTAAIAAGLAYLPEDRRRHGVIAEFSVTQNITLASLRAVSPHGLVNEAAETEVAWDYIRRTDIRPTSPDVPVGRLSGGNQQKVALSRWLATRPRVLLLDEPTQGVDVGAKAEIHRLMQELAEQGLAIVMISSELPEVVGMSDRIAVMRRGTIAAIVSRADATPERLMALALDVDGAEARP